MWARVGVGSAERAGGRSAGAARAGKRARRSGAQPGLDEVEKPVTACDVLRVEVVLQDGGGGIERHFVDLDGAPFIRERSPANEDHSGFVLVDENLAEANGALVFDTPKSHQKRLLRVGPSLAKRLGRHLETLHGGDDALLFTTPAGKPLRYNQWRKAYFDPAVSAAGLTDVTPHDLRASHGT